MGTGLTLSPLMGFSSNSILPFFGIDFGAHRGGLVLSLGWSGNWRLNLTRSASSIRLTASVGDLCTTVSPGESFQLLRALLVPVRPAAVGACSGALRDAMNLHKRILVDYKIPRKTSDGTVQGALTASWTWGGELY